MSNWWTESEKEIIKHYEQKLDTMAEEHKEAMLELGNAWSEVHELSSRVARLVRERDARTEERDFAEKQLFKIRRVLV